MKLATWNINGIGSRIGHVLNWCEANQPDVLCLQETKSVDGKFPHQKFRSVGFEYAAFAGEKAYNGVAILSRFPLLNVELRLGGDDADEAKRFVSATINGIHVVNVYVPHGTSVGSERFAFKLKWIARLRRHFDKNLTTDDRVILFGDLNVAPHEMDVWNPRLQQTRTHFSKPERDALLNLKKWGFVDLFRQFNDESGEYSWWSHFRHDFEKNRGMRIDHIWASPPVAGECLDCWIDRAPRALEKPSDHAPVVADIR